MSKFIEMDVTVKTKLKVEIDHDDVEPEDIKTDIIDAFDSAFCDAFGSADGWTEHEEIILELFVDGESANVELKIVEILDGPDVEVGGIAELADLDEPLSASAVRDLERMSSESV